MVNELFSEGRNEGRKINTERKGKVIKEREKNK